MGVSSGNADYFGPTVNRVARLMSLGHGGQVLLSSATQTVAIAIAYAARTIDGRRETSRTADPYSVKERKS
jgi:class 3 adenylate cyclase